MGKAIQGAAILAGAVAMGALAFVDPVLIATPFYAQAMWGLALGGISMEAGAIAGALTSNRGQNITSRQSAAFRQIIYGYQRVGGVEVYRSTTGSHKNQFNYVIVLATHEVWGIKGLYLDGRKVQFNTGVGTTNRNGIVFGGTADSNDHTGPDGLNYNFNGGVYCEACYGDQTGQPNTVPGGGYNTGLHANDPVWGPSASGTPYLGGCTYVYLKIEHNPTIFPGEPEIRFDILGKPVHDPRTGTTGYSHNWALIVNDVLTDPVYGLGDTSVNQDQLIAAANVCDEQVPLAAGGTESRYACHWHYDTSLGVGDVLSTLMGAAEGRLSRIGGEWYIWPAYFQGPSASFNAGHLTAPLQWTANKSLRDLFNRVTGTYTAANFPYNVAGDAYDASGLYNGEAQNNFKFEFQPTNYPQYACDTEHGYAADEYLNADGGLILSKEISRVCVLSISQAQRLAKISLLRNRQQGSGSFQMSLAAFQMQPCDTFQMTFASKGWNDKLLEVNSVSFMLDSGGKGSAPEIKLQIGVNETSASVYEWSTAEELTVYDTPASPSQLPNTPAPPTNIALTSSAATALLAADGTVYPRIEVSWDTPLDGLVKQIQMQYQVTGSSTWNDAGLVDVKNNTGYIGPVVAGTQYDVRIRSLRPNGASSTWTEVDGFTAGIVLSVLTQTGFGIGSLVGEAFNDGTAGIACEPFTASIGNFSVAVLPDGYTITGLNQSQLYYVYYIDPTGAGGAITPIATQNTADFRGKLGYFLIDSLVTPYAAPVSTGGGGSVGSRYIPSTYSDIGSRTTSSPAAAYDGDVTSDARVSGTYREMLNRTAPGGSAPSDPTTVSYTIGDCIWQGFPGIILATDATLSVVASVTSNGVPCTITAMGTTLLSTTATTAEATYTVTIPAGTNLNTVNIEAVCGGSQFTASGSPVNYTGSIQGFEIWVQS